MADNFAFVKVASPNGTNTLKLENGTQIEIDGKTYEVKNNCVFCKETNKNNKTTTTKVNSIMVSDYQKETLYFLANYHDDDTDKDNYNFGYFNEEDMDDLLDVKETLDGRIKEDPFIGGIRVTDAKGDRLVSISTPKSRAKHEAEKKEINHIDKETSIITRAWNLLKSIF